MKILANKIVIIAFLVLSVSCGTNHNLSSLQVESAYDIINKSVIGEIRTVHINCQMYKPDEYFESAVWKKEKGAGPVFVNLIHDLDLMNYSLNPTNSVLYIFIKSPIQIQHSG